MLRDALSSSKARFLLGLVVLWAGWHVWLWLAAPGKITGDFPPAAQRVNILVTLPFPPERFHVQKFQQFGRVSGTENTSVEVRGVPRSALETIARIYWVRQIEPLKPGG